jgi:hypothetical protein
MLFEEDESFSPSLTQVNLSWDAGQESGTLRRIGDTQRKQYSVKEWKRIN